MTPTAAERDRWYAELVPRVRAQVEAAVPRGARVLVISRGDEALLRLGSREAGHFPQTRTGLYAGHHPADGAAAAAHLTELRARGADYLVVPATATWWLEHYPELRTMLEDGGELVAGDAETALVYALAARRARLTTADELEAARTAPAAAALLRALLPDDAGVVLVGPSAAAVELGGRPCHRLSAEGEAVETTVARILAACARDARYVALLHPARPSDALDARLRRALAERLAPVCAQRLVEVFEDRD